MPRTTSSETLSPAGMRLLLTLCAIAFVAYLNQLMLWPFYVDVARDLHTPIPLLGQTTTLAVLVSAALGLFIGPWADHVGHRRTLLLGATGVVISAFGTAVAPTFLALLGARVLGGMSCGAVMSVALAVVATRFQGDERRKAMSWTIAALAAPTIGGIPVIAAFGGLVGWRWSFVLIGTIALGGWVLLRLALPADPPVGAESFRLRSVLAAYRPLVGHRPIMALFSGNALRSVAWMGMLTYFGAFWVVEKGLSVSGSGLMMMIGGTGYFAGSLAAGGRLGRFDQRLLFASTTAVSITLLGLVYILPVAPLALAPPLLAAGFVSAIGNVALTSLLAVETPAAPATTMALNGVVINLGGALGAMVGGGLLATGGYAALGSVLVVFGLVAAIAVWQPRRVARPAMAVIGAE